MTINRKVVLLWCLAGGFMVTNAVSPSPTKNPECPGMKRAASHIETGVEKFTREPIKCQVNKICTGLSCNGTHQSDPFYMKVILQHCMQPAPEIHLDLKFPAKKINIHKELKQGSVVKLYSAKNSGVETTVNLKMKLTRDKNRITSSIVLDSCTKAPVVGEKCTEMLPLLPKSTICVNMNTCKGFNTTGYPPCHAATPVTPNSSPTKSSLSTPTGSSKTPIRTIPRHSSSTATNLPSTTLTKKTGFFKTTQPFHGHSSSKPSISSTKNPDTQKTTPFSERFHGHSSSKPTSNWTTQNPEPFGGNKDHQHGDKHHGMSVKVAVGIGFACIAVIGIIVGVIVYYKKYHHRARLRAAYYNDISMNDPLYEDFGPEVA